MYSVAGSGTIGDHGGLMVSNISLNVANALAGYWGPCLSQGAPPPAWVANCSLDVSPWTRNNLENPALVCDPTHEPPANLPSDVINGAAPCTDPWTQQTITQGFPFPLGMGWIFGVPGFLSGTWGLGGYLDGNERRMDRGQTKGRP